MFDEKDAEPQGVGAYAWPVQCQMCGEIYSTSAANYAEFEMLQGGEPMQPCPECGSWLALPLFTVNDEGRESPRAADSAEWLAS